MRMADTDPCSAARMNEMKDLFSSIEGSEFIVAESSDSLAWAKSFTININQLGLQVDFVRGELDHNAGGTLWSHLSIVNRRTVGHGPYPRHRRHKAGHVEGQDARAEVCPPGRSVSCDGTGGERVVEELCCGDDGVAEETVDEDINLWTSFVNTDIIEILGGLYQAWRF